MYRDDPLAFTLVALHVISGFLGIVAGLMPFMASKGSANHRYWGKVSLYAMVCAGVTALPLAILISSWLQVIVGILALYSCVVTIRSLRRSRSAPSKRILFAGIATSLALFAGLSILYVRENGAESFMLQLIYCAILLALATFELVAELRKSSSVPGIVTEHGLASCCAMCVGWSSFFSTQLQRMTGLELSTELKLTLPFLIACPLLAILIPRWRAGIAARGLSFFNRSAVDTDVQRLRFFSIAEVISFLALLLIAVPLKWIAGEPQFVRIAGPVHGSLTLMYLASVFPARGKLGWDARQTIWALIAGIVPLGTIFVHNILRDCLQLHQKSTAGEDENSD